MPQYVRPLLDRLKTRFIEILVDQNHEYAELQGGMVATAWGLWVLQGYYDNWVPGRNYTYDYLFAFAPHEIWGTIFFLLGMLQLGGLLFNSYSVRRWSSCVAVVCWLFVAVFFSLADWRVLAVPMYFMFALGAAWGFIHIGWTRKG